MSWRQSGRNKEDWCETKAEVERTHLEDKADVKKIHLEDQVEVTVAHLKNQAEANMCVCHFKDQESSEDLMNTGTAPHNGGVEKEATRNSVFKGGSFSFLDLIASHPRKN